MFVWKNFLTAIDCGQLDPPANGTVDTSQGSLLGAVATYSCDPSFTLVGTATRQCQEDETWTGESPTCEGKYYINIEFLDKILYKFLKMNHYSCSSIKWVKFANLYFCEWFGRYYCGTWRIAQILDESLPLSVTVCPVLENPEFGSVSHAAGRGIGSEATYSCDARYTLIGDPVRTCLESQEWSGQPPTCECKED